MIKLYFETWKYKYLETCKCKTIMKHSNLKHANQNYFEICKSKTNMKHTNIKLILNMHF